MTTAKESVSLLLVEDSASEAKRLADVLAGLTVPVGEVRQASTVAGAVGALQHESFDVVMLDLALPDAMGLDGLRRVRAIAPMSAVIVRTSRSEEQLAAEALAAGAHEYLLKDGAARAETVDRAIRVALARHRAEEAARQLAAVVDSSDEAIIALTLEGKIASWNAAAERTYGYPPAYAIGRDIWFLAASSSGGRDLRRRLGKLRAGETVRQTESVHRRADGAPIEVTVRLAAIPGTGQKPTAAVAVVRDVTATKQSERERARILARLRETQRIARLGFWTLDSRAGVGSWSPEMTRMFGREASAPVSLEDWLGYVASDEQVRVRGLLSGSTAGREFAFDCFISVASELARTVHVIGRGDPDDPEVLLGTAQDVTELHAAEQALRASRAELVDQRELLSAVVDNAPSGLAIVQVPGERFLRVNQALCRTLGYREEELLGRTTLELTHPEEHARGRQAARRLLAGEIRTYQSELRLFHHDGHLIWAELSISLIRDDSGEPRYFVAQFSDISDRKQFERDLQRERDHTAAILAAIGEGYALSVDGRITEVNDALCILTGYEREELVGAGQPWPFWPRLAGTWSPDSAGPPPETILAQMMRKDGARFEAEVTARGAHNPDGSILGWVIAIRDVSERRRYEAELERLATHDALTGLANHRLFHQRLSEEMAQAMRHDRPLSVAILDLDRFKQINDAHGHLVGDQALSVVAARLASVVREGELLARVGGEEFAWILPEADEVGAFTAAERARSVVSGEVLAPVGTITISAGVATRQPGVDASALYERADQALLLAKREGRDRTVRWGAAEGSVVR